LSASSTTSPYSRGRPSGQNLNLPCATLEELVHDRSADPAATAGDNDNGAIDFCHDDLSVRVV
jgi:hypothetical protein